ncbi:uncharacterized protein LACBIDRAFT_294976 [Laccaria bicolor S238N-H82]|uniref:Predicted protein n=1 Tax=Laccaria bicolor (strain S238N-H82 / ATCC MYA-4686) TaxID=486041 RepID=B0DKL4_LACBS|nr:uncharacterized protein LACBIDRAFT_294976 [Laccaria bicolor S238N-H82]EDR04965.1 predicted protein [Laccaria bicolor S238N-H82]|eukprot:XP_001884355.1 predicted protein [Laccaria bicolor S238N-H82]
MSMFNDSQGVIVQDDAKVTNAGRDVVNIQTTTVNNYPSSTLKVVPHQRSLMMPTIHSKSPKWTPKNRICRAQQRNCSTLDFLNQYEDVMDEGAFLECTEFIVNSTASSEIEDKGWLAFLCDAHYRRSLVHYTSDVKRVNNIAQRGSQQGVCLKANRFHNDRPILDQIHVQAESKIGPVSILVIPEIYADFRVHD